MERITRFKLKYVIRVTVSIESRLHPGHDIGVYERSDGDRYMCNQPKSGDTTGWSVNEPKYDTTNLMYPAGAGWNISRGTFKQGVKDGIIQIVRSGEGIALFNNKHKLLTIDQNT